MGRGPSYPPLRPRLGRVPEEEKVDGDDDDEEDPMRTTGDSETLAHEQAASRFPPPPGDDDDDGEELVPPRKVRRPAGQRPAQRLPIPTDNLVSPGSVMSWDVTDIDIPKNVPLNRVGATIWLFRSPGDKPGASFSNVQVYLGKRVDNKLIFSPGGKAEVRDMGSMRHVASREVKAETKIAIAPSEWTQIWQDAPVEGSRFFLKDFAILLPEVRTLAAALGDYEAHAELKWWPIADARALPPKDVFKDFHDRLSRAVEAFPQLPPSKQDPELQRVRGDP